MASPDDEPTDPVRQSRQSLEQGPAAGERSWCEAIVMQLLEELGLEEFELA